MTPSGAYDAGSWAAGPGPIYERLSAAAIGACPVPLSGALVLDAGAGTGAAARALLAAGARGFACDLSTEMLAYERASRPPAVAGDVRTLPFRDCAFDAAVAAFVLSHVESPASALAELGRVTRPGGVVLGVQFALSSGHAAKAAVERTAALFGFSRPGWYGAVLAEGDELGSPDRFAKVAREAGLRDVRACEIAVDVDVRTPHELLRWRLGIPAMSRFVGDLERDTRTRFLADAEQAIGPDPDPYVPVIVVMTAVC